jgi:hypothetical protein
MSSCSNAPTSTGDCTWVGRCKTGVHSTVVYSRSRFPYSRMRSINRLIRQNSGVRVRSKPKEINARLDLFGYAPALEIHYLQIQSKRPTANEFRDSAPHGCRRQSSNRASRPRHPYCDSCYADHDLRALASDRSLRLLLDAPRPRWSTGRAYCNSSDISSTSLRRRVSVVTSPRSEVGMLNICRSSTRSIVT